MQDPFWGKHYHEFKVQEPSQFAQYCANRYMQQDDVLVELGCGNGRDGLMLSGRVAQYVGIDACGVAIESFTLAANQSPPNGRQSLDLRQADFTSLDFNEVGRTPGRLAIYSRFSLHAINYEEQERLINNLESIQVSPWIFMLEARTIYDELYGVGRNIGPHEYETDHYRRFIDPSEFLKQVSARFAVTYFEVSNGFSSFGKENPMLMRAVIQGK